MSKENAIEWMSGSHTVTLSLSSKRHITMVKKLKEKYPEEIELYHENVDGTILAHVPLDWIKIRHPRVMSEEAKAAAAERLRGLRNED